MEDANFLEEDDSHATTLALADLPAKAFEQGFYVRPSDVQWSLLPWSLFP